MIWWAMRTMFSYIAISRGVRVSSQPMANGSADTTRSDNAGGRASINWVVVGVRQSVGLGEVLGGVDADALRIALGDQVGQALPLVGLRLGVPGFLKSVAHVVAGHG